ncbi:folate-binding protein YgfZ [Rhizobium sp. TH2]|uniref:CAF17-like 4Fe-4S cluster assembly/insertion protein YgfZ n=1 Tax=Rhizobium sp. TH2 TaxID=2775403 RepID=UPI0021579B04|nr:folate-binding protein [Rhizobium sp. TH2]UVC10578.1 folate-binding protein YgfZ [Rhizobium sp. TH2]
MPQTTLENRTFIAVAGPEAEDFLQAIITTDLPSVGPGEAWPGALLTPQGKIMFEFLIARSADGFVIETDAASGDPFAKRLTLYRLRAKVTIAKLEANAATAFWDTAAPEGAVRDMRFAKAGVDLFRMPDSAQGTDVSAYTALRIVHGISGGAEDGDATDFFPHDLLLDRNGGLNFKKGCYVGQEVVSRMQHRSTARRRIVTVSADSALPASGAAILAGGKDIGTLRTVEGNTGLAVVRIDKAGDAMVSGTSISAGDVAVTLALPAWSGVEFPAMSDEAAS